MKDNKYILGLDLGVNSIGWAVIKKNTETSKLIGVECAGSRIIPTDGDTLGKYNSGSPTDSAASERTTYRSARKMGERFLLRRERLHRTLHVLGFLPKHYDNSIGWEWDDKKSYGKFINNCEVKLAWNENYEFIFTDSYEEMRQEFQQKQPSLKSVSHDWTLYFLRKKALTQAISKEELAWIILNFNQKRGYYQREENDIDTATDKKEEYYALRVVSVNEAKDNKKGGDIWYEVHLENGFIYKRKSKVPLDSWVGQIKEFIVTTKLEKDGSEKINKYGDVDRTFRAPSENDWGLKKKKTEVAIEKSGLTIGEYIYSTLLSKPTQKIKGTLVATIERKFYKDELLRIINKQKEYIPELSDRDLYAKCVEELYLNNNDHRNQIATQDFSFLFCEDIIYYHRPLKSKKYCIADCAYEYREYTKGGELIQEPLKCIAKSNPLYQEFRLWQFIKNLRIYERGDELTDCTSRFLSSKEDIIALFTWLNKRKDITQKSLLSFPGFDINKKDISNYRWNFIDDDTKSYPCNETRTLINKYLAKADINPEDFNSEQEKTLWHILYSVTDKEELRKALIKFGKKNQLGNSFADTFTRFPLLKKEYGTYSEKAIKKLLQLIRIGEYWNADDIDKKTKERIDKIITGEYDEKIRNRVREKAIDLRKIEDFNNLPIWLACYIVYDRHSEAKDITLWETPDDLDEFIRTYNTNTPINPIVKKLVLETLRTVRDIWKKVGHIDEIHLELAREMRNTADERKKITERISKNESTNIRIKQLLSEFKDPFYEVEGVREFSPKHQELLRIYEDDAIDMYRSENKDLPEDINIIKGKLSNTDPSKAPTKAEINKYKLWLEQNYRSPYTGLPIPFARLFTSDYEIEHIIPRSRFFDDSFSNKVICESAVNKLKDNLLGFEFINLHGGQIVELPMGKTAKILSVDAYKQVITTIGNSKKRKNLLMDEVPDSFTTRQLNDTRYISSLIKGYLSNIVREEGEQEAVSKHLVVCNGAVTDSLKKDWGMNDVWNKIVAPRFARMNTLKGEDANNGPFGYWDSEKNCFKTSMPIGLQAGFQKKRIDHRHHAMDAIVIACATRSHVNYLNNQSAKTGGKNYHQLKHTLFDYVDVEINGEKRSVPNLFTKPWETFTQDAFAVLQNIIVSQRQILRVLSPASNKYQKYVDGKKQFVSQESDHLYAIRKPLHKESVYGNVNLREISQVKLSVAMKNPSRIVEKDFKNKLRELMAMPSYRNNENLIKKYFTENKEAWGDIDISKIKVYTFSEEGKNRYAAKRTSLISLFDKVKKDKVKDKIDSITDTGIQKILRKHYAACNEDPLTAFSPEGIDTMNENIVELNDGKFHQTIRFVRVYEALGEKFQVGSTGNKSSKYVVAAKGTNLFFAVYEKISEDKKTGETIKSRTYETIPFSEIIERAKQGLASVPETNEEGCKLLFSLSPNDLVYVPRKDQIGKELNVVDIDKSRIYKMVSCSLNRCWYINNNIAKVIVDKSEYTSMNKVENTDNNQSIKEVCIPIKVNSLGEFTHINGVHI